MTVSLQLVTTTAFIVDRFKNCLSKFIDLKKDHICHGQPFLRNAARVELVYGDCAAPISNLRFPIPHPINNMNNAWGPRPHSPNQVTRTYARHAARGRFVAVAEFQAPLVAARGIYAEGSGQSKGPQARLFDFALIIALASLRARPQSSRERAAY